MHVSLPLACLKVKFNMLPEKLLVNNLISYVPGIMGEKKYLRKILLYSLRSGRYIASVIKSSFFSNLTF